MNRETQFAIGGIALLLAERKNSYFSVEVKKRLPWLLSLLKKQKFSLFYKNDEERAGLNPTGIPKEEQLISGISRSFDRLLTLTIQRLYSKAEKVESLNKRLDKTIWPWNESIIIVKSGGNQIDRIELAHEYTRNLAITKSNLSAQMANSQKFPSVSTRLVGVDLRVSG